MSQQQAPRPPPYPRVLGAESVPSKPSTAPAASSRSGKSTDPPTGVLVRRRFSSSGNVKNTDNASSGSGTTALPRISSGATATISAITPSSSPGAVSVENNNVATNMDTDERRTFSDGAITSHTLAYLLKANRDVSHRTSPGPALSSTMMMSSGAMTASDASRAGRSRGNQRSNTSHNTILVKPAQPHFPTDDSWLMRTVQALARQQGSNIGASAAGFMSSLETFCGTSSTVRQTQRQTRDPATEFTPKTLIPQEYWIYSEAPLVATHHGRDHPNKTPNKAQQQQSGTVSFSFSDSGNNDPFCDVHHDSETKTWKKRAFPSGNPSSRGEVYALAATLDCMSVSIDTTVLTDAEACYGTSENAKLEQTMRSLYEVNNVGLAEIVRQCYSNCAERGVLLDRIRCLYADVFESCLSIISYLRKQARTAISDVESSRLVVERLKVECETAISQSTTLRNHVRKQEEEMEKMRDDLASLETLKARERVFSEFMQRQADRNVVLLELGGNFAEQVVSVEDGHAPSVRQNSRTEDSLVVAPNGDSSSRAIGGRGAAPLSQLRMSREETLTRIFGPGGGNARGGSGRGRSDGSTGVETTEKGLQVREGQIDEKLYHQFIEFGESVKSTVKVVETMGAPYYGAMTFANPLEAATWARDKLQDIISKFVVDNQKTHKERAQYIDETHENPAYGTVGTFLFTKDMLLNVMTDVSRTMREINHRLCALQNHVLEILQDQKAREVEAAEAAANAAAVAAAAGDTALADELAEEIRSAEESLLVATSNKVVTADSSAQCELLIGVDFHEALAAVTNAGEDEDGSVSRTATLLPEDFDPSQPQDYNMPDNAVEFVKKQHSAQIQDVLRQQNADLEDTVSGLRAHIAELEQHMNEIMAHGGLSDELKKRLSVRPLSPNNASISSSAGLQSPLTAQQQQNQQQLPPTTTMRSSLNHSLSELKDSTSSHANNPTRLSKILALTSPAKDKAPANMEASSTVPTDDRSPSATPSQNPLPVKPDAPVVTVMPLNKSPTNNEDDDPFSDNTTRSLLPGVSGGGKSLMSPSNTASMGRSGRHVIDSTARIKSISINRKKGHARPKTLSWLLRLVYSVYKSRLRVLGVLPPMSIAASNVTLADTFFDHLKQSYGAKSIVDEYCTVILNTIDVHKRDPRVALFHKFLFGDYNNTVLANFLWGLKLCEDSTIGPEYGAGADDNAVAFARISLIRAIFALGSIFESTPDAIRSISDELDQQETGEVSWEEFVEGMARVGVSGQQIAETLESWQCSDELGLRFVRRVDFLREIADYTFQHHAQSASCGGSVLTHNTILPSLPAAE